MKDIALQECFAINHSQSILLLITFNCFIHLDYAFKFDDLLYFIIHTSVPAANFSNSKTPIGPFQMIV